MPADDIEPSSPTEPQPPRLRGLWGVMASHGAETGDEVVTDSDSAPHPDEVKPRSLWGVMGAATETSELAPAEVPVTSVADLPAETQTDPFAPTALVTVVTRKRGLTGDQWALIAGLFAVPASSAGYWPSFAAALPGAALGFVAVWLAALHGFSSTQSRAARWRAFIGGGLGCLALALGPFVFTPWGNAARDRAATLETQSPPPTRNDSDGKP